MSTNITIVDNFQSDSESCVEDVASIQRKAKKRCRVWNFEKHFPNVEEAKAAINGEKCWSYAFANKTEEGMKVYYRCNRVKFRGKQCDAGIHLVHDSRSDEVNLFRANADHKHDNNESKSILSVEAKELIKELFKLKAKPKRIREIFIERAITPIPSEIQLRNQLVHIRKEIYGPPTISLGELEHWLNLSSAIPESDDQAFVVNYQVIYNDEDDNPDASEDDDDEENNDGPKFRFFISSKRLLKLVSTSTILNADATYKLIWQGYPVLIVGTTDLDRHFHSIGLGVCTDEKTADFKFIFSSINIGLGKINESLFNPDVLVSDAAGAIRKAYEKVFRKTEMVMCWAHMRRNCVKNIETLVSKDDQDEMIEDIDQLQLSQSTEIFKRAVSLFIKKWKTKNAKEFLQYMNKKWLSTHNSWYEGYKHFTPSTNNGLESNNRIIKDEQTIRERVPLSRFSQQALEIVSKWSLAYPRDLKVFINKPTIGTPLWTQAYQWAKQNKTILSVSAENTTCYYVPAGDAMTINQDDIDKFERMLWTTFEKFKRRAFSIWCTTFPNDNTKWSEGRCNCPDFFKKFICKHVVGIAIRLKFCRAPGIAKSVSIGKRLPRGRPSKAKKALLKQ